MANPELEGVEQVGRGKKRGKVGRVWKEEQEGQREEEEEEGQREEEEEESGQREKKEEEAGQQREKEEEAMLAPGHYGPGPTSGEGRVGRGVGRENPGLAPEEDHSGLAPGKGAEAGHEGEGMGRVKMMRMMVM